MAEKKKEGTGAERGYGLYLRTSKIGVSPAIWIGIAIALAAALGFLMFFAFPQSPTVSVISVVALPVLIIGLPIILKQRRDTRMEEAVPDVFEELATSLRAGGTIEQALLDLTKIQKGPLIEELKIALNDMEGGFSFGESLENLVSRVDVPLLKRTFTIVIDGKKAGGELADILDAVASDARQMARLQRERMSKTLMYVAFIFAAGAVVAPLIFGFVTEIAVVVANVGVRTEVANPLNLPGTSLNIFWIYLLIETFISGVMLAVVRGIRIWKGLVFYSLTMALTATVVFEISKIVASAMLGG